MDQITKSDIVALMAKQRKTHAPGSCNRLLILLRYMFSLAKKWETPGVKSNPTEGIPLMTENNKKERFLSAEEAQRLYAAVSESTNPMLKFIIPMLILSGARKREVLDARWEDFDLDRRLWRIPMTKLGRPRHVPMSDGVLRLLDAVPRMECPWVFANPKTLKPFESGSGRCTDPRSSPQFCFPTDQLRQDALRSSAHSWTHAGQDHSAVCTPLAGHPFSGSQCCYSRP
jgi:integrase